MASDEQAVQAAVCSLLDKIQVAYHILHEDIHTLPCYPVYGQVYIYKDLAEGKIRNTEAELEDK